MKKIAQQLIFILEEKDIIISEIDKLILNQVIKIIINLKIAEKNTKRNKKKT